VLNVNATLDPVSGGGTTERPFRLSWSIAKAGARCAVPALDAGLMPERVGPLAGTRVVALPLLWGRCHVSKVSSASLKEVRAAVEGSDVVYLTNHWALLNAVVHLLAHPAGKPYVVCPAGVLPIYGRSRLPKTAYNRLVGHGIIRNAAGHVAVAGLVRSSRQEQPSRRPPRQSSEQNVRPTSSTPGFTTLRLQNLRRSESRHDGDTVRLMNGKS